MSVGEFEHILLVALLQLGGRAHGGAIRAEIESRTGRDVSAGAVYTAMERLQNRGFVDSELGEPTARRGGRRKRIYTIESDGREAVYQRIQTLRQMTEGLTLENPS